SEGDIEMLVEAAEQKFGDLHVFFANAGIGGGFEGIFDSSVAEWQEVLRVNLIGPFLAVKYAGKVIAESGHGGSIICTASVAGIRSGAGGPAYSASKAGVINLVKVASQQFATSNVRCNAICPGITETGMTQFIYDRARENGQQDGLGYLDRLRRISNPIQMAAVALFCASARLSYVYGQGIAVYSELSASCPVPREYFGGRGVYGFL